MLAARDKMTGLVPLQNPPQILAAKAHDFIQQFGYTAAPADSASGLRYDRDYLRYIEDKDKAPNRWEQLRSGSPSAIQFWYRESPRYLEVEKIFGGGPVNGVVLPDDPPRDVSGMTYVVLGPSGRLAYFEAVPPQRDEEKGTAPAPDWAALFTAAGLDIATFKAVGPERGTSTRIRCLSIRRAATIA